MSKKRELYELHEYGTCAYLALLETEPLLWRLITVHCKNNLGSIGVGCIDARRRALT